MDVLERIENGELNVAVWPFSRNHTTQEKNELTKKLLRLSKLGQATEKGLEKIEITISCKGIYESEPCKEIEAKTLGCALKYFCELRTTDNL